MNKYCLNHRFALLFDDDEVCLTEGEEKLVVFSKEDIGGFLFTDGIVCLRGKVIFTMHYNEFSDKMEIMINSDDEEYKITIEAENIIEGLKNVYYQRR
jgi:hypothetical protein